VSESPKLELVAGGLRHGTDSLTENSTTSFIARMVARIRNRTVFGGAPSATTRNTDKGTMKYLVILNAEKDPVKVEANDVEISECETKETTYWNFTNEDGITVAAIPFSNVYAILPTT